MWAVKKKENKTKTNAKRTLSLYSGEGKKSMAITLAAARKQWAEENTQLIKLVKMILAVSEMGQNQLGEKLGMSSVTLRSRMKNPSAFRKSEEQTIRYLAEVYGIKTA